MRRLIQRYPVESVSVVLLAAWLALFGAMEFWVFRPLPYQAPVWELDLNQRARSTVASVLTIDGWLQGAVARLRGDTPSPDVVLVNVGNDVLGEVNAFPMPRSIIAEIYRKISALGPSTVLVDMLFAWPQTPWVGRALDRQYTRSRDRNLLSLRAELDYDGRLKDALKALNYVLIYIPTWPTEFLLPQQRQKFAAEMVLHARQAPPVDIVGKGVNGLYPYQHITGLRPSIVPLRLNARGHGFAWQNNDRQGNVAQVPLLHPLQTTSVPPASLFLPHATLEAVRVHLGQKRYRLELDRGRAVALSVGSRRIATDAAAEININFYGRGDRPRIPKIEAMDLLRDKVPRDRVAGKIVVVGSDINLLHDYLATPVGSIWGTEVLATAVSNLLNGDSFYRPYWASWAEFGLILLTVAAVLLSTRKLRPQYAVIAAVAGFSLATLLVVVALWWRGILLSVTAPLGIGVLIFLQITIMRHVLEERQKRFYRTALGLYLSPELTEMVADRPEILSLSGKEEELTVLFSDIRDFTSISESMGAVELTTFLQEYLSPMTDIVFDMHGTLDKFIGDAVMAFWGAPLPDEDHAASACEAALRMLEKVAELTPSWLARGLPPIRIGIGLSTGPMRVGNMGSDRRLSYTVMGDNVNLGARLEGLTKFYGVRLVVSGATWERVSDRFHGRELDRVMVKGKDVAVPVFEVVGRGVAPPETARSLAEWAEAIARYKARDWNAAEPVFERWATERDDATARLYLANIADFRITPPPSGWRAENRMDTK